MFWVRRGLSFVVEEAFGKEGQAMIWAVAREQLVLFPTSLDEAVPQDHLVRVLDEILRALDWSQFEAKYHGRLGPSRFIRGY